ncbi:MAG: GNAT family N-acetyltransferase [Spirochaetaceae bacterium]|jgi:ribosomal protein S18 acetylase RimI-like enzyme|nr:GNAT family N-acetyltransferase [Spirochaetaceae bacterium]
MNTDFTLEELSMNAWPSIQTSFYDGWIIRMANGYTKRANSINPIYPSKLKMNEKISCCEKIFRAHKLPVIYKLVDCAEHRMLDKQLERLGYEKIDSTSVQVCNTLKPVAGKITGIKISDGFTDSWIQALLNCNKIRQSQIETIMLMLNNILAKKIVVYKKEEGSIIGCGYGVVEKSWVGIFDIIVREDMRGRGYGEEIVRSLLASAKNAGALRAYLQVVDTNDAAKNLYKKLGFREKYQYWYRKKA